MKNSFKGSFGILLAALLFIGAIFVYSSFIQPVYSQIKEMQGSQTQKEADYAKFQSIFDKNQQVLSSFQNLADLKNNILIMLPTSPNISQAIYQINGIASASGLVTESISANDIATTPGKTSVIKSRGATRFTIRMHGSYEAFKSFADRVETNIRIFRINSIRIEKSSVSPNILNFTAEIDAFYQID